MNARYDLQYVISQRSHASFPQDIESTLSHGTLQDVSRLSSAFLVKHRRSTPHTGLYR